MSEHEDEDGTFTLREIARQEIAGFAEAMREELLLLERDAAQGRLYARHLFHLLDRALTRWRQR